MDRIHCPQMLGYDWKKEYEDIGFTYHSVDGAYMVQDYCYVVKRKEAEALYKATQELESAGRAFVGETVARGDYRGYDFNDHTIRLIEDSWNDSIQTPDNKPFSLYGRYDFLLDLLGNWKMLEYNADTPTCLLEASVVQWKWLERFNELYLNSAQPLPREGCDQYNTIHEELIEAFEFLRSSMPLEHQHLMFTAAGGAHLVGDWANLYYMMDCALQAGMNPSSMEIEGLGWDGKQLVDPDGIPVQNLFKLYPWEYMVRDEFAQYLEGSWDNGVLNVMQPAWRLLMSHKNFLVRMSEEYPNHPNILKAQYAQPVKGDWVRKPVLAREGWNVSMLSNGVLEKPQAYDAFYDGEDQRYIYQERVFGPRFGDRIPVFGSWVIGDEPSGLGCREEINKQVTTDSGLFVPHVILD
jgi:glutathionylspermidine synthase